MNSRGEKEALRLLDPEDLDEVGDRVKFRVSGDHNRIQAHCCAHDESIGIREGKPSLNPGCFQNVSERIRDVLDGQGFQAVEKLLSRLLGSLFGRDIVHLPDVHLIHQQRRAGSLGAMHQLPDFSEPFLFVEEGEQGEGIEQIGLFHAFAPLVVP